MNTSTHASQTILTTGGTGYIGSHTAVELIQAGYTVEILDNLANSKIQVLDRIEELTGVRPKFHQIDLLDQAAVDELFASTHFDAVIHFAGLKAVGESVEQPLKYYRNNLTGTLNLLDSMLKHDCQSIVFSSSATVYGLQDSPACVETMTTGVNVSNPYGWTKAMIEQILRDTAAANPGLKVTLLRYFNPIGNHPSGLLGEDPNGRPNNLMPIVMRVAAGKIPELTVYGNDYDTPDGTCRRDYIHVVDLAKGHLAALEHQAPGTTVYNLGTGQPTSVLEMITAFETASGEKLPYKIGDRRPGDLADLWAVPDEAARELGWQTELTVADAMRDTLKYLEHEK